MYDRRSRVQDLEKAYAYREAELPFIVYNAPEAEDVVTKWNKPGYLENLLGNERYRTEVIFTAENDSSSPTSPCLQFPASSRLYTRP